MQYLSVVLLIFELIWSLEINGKYILLRIGDQPFTLPNEVISGINGNNVTSSRAIKKRAKASQTSCKKSE